MIFDYLDGGAGSEEGLISNRLAFDAMKLVPRYLCGSEKTTEPETTIFDERYSIPLGVSPVGAAGLIWPGAELSLARLASDARIPFVLSMVATATPEDIIAIAGPRAWLQVYPTKDKAILTDIISRAHRAGYKVLVATIDSPSPARRNRDIRNGFRTSSSFNAQTIFQFCSCPRWLLQIARHGGVPECVTFLPYMPGTARNVFERISFAEGQVKDAVWTKKTLQCLREQWPGKLVIKGVLSQFDAEIARETGADGMIISNHGGRQLEAAPASVDILLRISDKYGHLSTLMLDSGIRSGLDVVRALAAGAQLCFSGRSFYYAIAALGPAGGRLAIQLLKDEYERSLAQLGCSPREALDFYQPSRNLGERSSMQAS